MMKRKGESYLGGHTVVTLHPSTVEAGLVDQARECQRQAREDQQHFDTVRAKERMEADRTDYESHSQERRARNNVEKFYRARLYEIERYLITKPHPRIVRSLLAEQLTLLEKVLHLAELANVRTNGIKERIYHTRQKLERLEAHADRRRQ